MAPTGGWEAEAADVEGMVSGVKAVVSMEACMAVGLAAERVVVATVRRRCPIGWLPERR